MDWIRQPAVSGKFYPGDADDLTKMLKDFFDSGPAPERQKPFAAIAPHAGYIYSGKIAAQVFRRLEIPKTVILLGPNHTGLGKRISIWNKGSWLTPLGEVGVDGALADRILQKVGEDSGDQDSHEFEHCLEVQLPFLQYLSPSVTIVPIVLGPLRADACLKIGRAIAEAVSELAPNDTLLLASTDMSHYISAQEAGEKDALALRQIERLDPANLYRTVADNEISMCGFIPTTCVLQAASQLGARRGEILAYGNSGEATGDLRRVVAYASGWAL